MSNLVPGRPRRPSYRRANTSLSLTGVGGTVVGAGGLGDYPASSSSAAMAPIGGGDGGASGLVLNGGYGGASGVGAAKDYLLGRSGAGGQYGDLGAASSSSKWSYQPPPAPPPALPAAGGVHDQVVEIESSTIVLPPKCIK